MNRFLNTDRQFYRILVPVTRWLGQVGLFSLTTVIYMWCETVIMIVIVDSKIIND